MTALIVIAIIVGAVVAFSAIAEAIRRLRKAARPEDGLEAIATREAPQWTDEQIDRLAETLRKEGEER